MSSIPTSFFPVMLNLALKQVQGIQFQPFFPCHAELVSASPVVGFRNKFGMTR